MGFTRSRVGAFGSEMLGGRNRDTKEYRDRIEQEGLSTEYAVYFLVFLVVSLAFHGRAISPACPCLFSICLYIHSNPKRVEEG